LLREEWHTRLDGQTDASGTLRFRGFCGEYALRRTDVRPSVGRRFNVALRGACAPEVAFR
jgi:hypothetical protein